MIATGERLPSGAPDAVRPRIRLQFHLKSKFQIKSRKISWLELWTDGAGSSSLFSNCSFSGCSEQGAERGNPSWHF